jgi:hypothetical protein
MPEIATAIAKLQAEAGSRKPEAGSRKPVECQRYSK